MPFDNDIEFFKSYKELTMKVRGRSGHFGGDAPMHHYPPSLEIEPTHIKIDLQLDLKAQVAEVIVTTTVVAKRQGGRRLELDGVGFHKLCVRDPSGASLSHGYDGRKIEILWHRPFEKGEQRNVECRYRVEQPISGLFFLQPTTLEPGLAYYAATDHETERARYWLSCIDLPNVRTTVEFIIKAPQDLTILANGQLVLEELDGQGAKSAVWRLDQRCPSYLICFAVGNFVRYDDGAVGGIPLSYFGCGDFTPEDLARTFAPTKAMLAWMTRKLGMAYPFPKYFQFALPDFSGAMENISLVSWDDRNLCSARRHPEAQHTVDQTNLHEMAHAFFGNLVVCRDFAHAWLKESWATYMETCWLEDTKGRDEQLYDLYCNARDYFAEVDARYSRPLVTRRFTSSWQMYDRHLYPGGACRLHTLRQELGDNVFWPAVHDYLNTYREKVVETDDFRRVLELHSGRSLQKFFDQWLHSPEYPRLKVTFTFDQDTKLGTFTVDQQQVDAKRDSHPFELHTDLGWTVSGESHMQAITITRDRQSFQVPMAADPEQVRFDPQARILHQLEFDPGVSKLKNQLTNAQDVIGRILAAKTLAASGDRANLRTVTEAYYHEAHWGVRREMISALADSGTATAVEALANFISGAREEKHPLVMGHLFAAVGAFRDPMLTESLVRRLRSDSSLGPATRAAAYGALGRQGTELSEPALTLLREATAVGNQQYGDEQGAAWQALARTGREEFVPMLLHASRPGATPHRARARVATALGLAINAGSDRGQRQALEQRLVDLLRDPTPSVAYAAAYALGAARVRTAIGNLEAYRATLNPQDQVNIDAVLANLHSNDDAKVKALAKEVDDLRAKLRKLSEKVDDLSDRAKQHPSTHQ